jgi:hypothetical protein
MSANSSDPTSDVGLPDAIVRSPDPGRRRRRWQWVQDHLPERLQRVYALLVVPADPPEGFGRTSLQDLARSLTTADVGTARAILAEAEAAHSEPYERIESAERRATTLQGTVAIAASAAVAGAGLLLGDASIEGTLWRAGFAVFLVLAVGALLACAVRAVGVTGRMFQFEEPGLERITYRATMTESEALTLRAAELLRAADVADMIGAIKVGLLRAAAWWFRTALVMLGLVAALVCAYVVSHSDSSTATTTSTTIIVPFGMPELSATPVQPGTATARAPSTVRKCGRRHCP